MEALAYRQDTEDLLATKDETERIEESNAIFFEIVHAQFRREVYLSADDRETIEESHKALTKMMLDDNHDSDYVFKPFLNSVG